MSEKLAHIVMFSGGVGSWATAKRVAARHGADGITLLFADTLCEDPDLYRFLDEAAADVGAPLVRISEGRTPWQVMSDENIIGNSRIDPCSKILKRKFLDRWRNENCTVGDTVIYVGIDWTESHRLETIRKRTAPWRYEAPLCEPPYLSRGEVFDQLRVAGIKPPKLYEQGFPHNNCAGACVKAGQAQWALLLRTNRKLYLEREAWEDGMRERVGNHSILKDRRGGQTKPLSLRAFRHRIDQQADAFNDNEWGGCACGV